MQYLQTSKVISKLGGSRWVATLTTHAKPQLSEDAFKGDSIPFDVAKHGTFFQQPPALQNPYLGDSLLQGYLRRHLPKEVLAEVHPDLVQFGDRASGELSALALECEQKPPRLVGQDAWGSRKDQLHTCSAWQKMHAVSAKEGLIAIGYEREYSQWSRLYQMAKLYLFAPSSGLYSCPLAMTDGAAKTIQSLKLEDAVFQNAYNHFTSRIPQLFWTSGQWMTEKRGGSDVSNGTETIAIPQADGTFRLHGYKWFTSALDAHSSLTLARIVDPGHGTSDKKLTMFFLNTKDHQGNWNHIQSVRLKDKLGTRQLPTAELLLTGSVAHQMSEEGRGVASIANMLTMTRIHNGLSSVSAMKRVLLLARDYSKKRIAFGQSLDKYPLHMQTLARMDTEHRGSMLLFLQLANILGKEECGLASEEETFLLRILTPIFKLYTAKQAVSVASEGLESFGGQGYMEDTGLPLILRDAQVLPIWEGTTNILSLDVLRSVAKTKGQVLQALSSDVLRRLGAADQCPDLKLAKDKVLQALMGIGQFVQQHPESLQVAARDLAYSIARTYIGALTVEYASHPESSNIDVVTAQRWCCIQDLAPVVSNQLCGLYQEEAIQSDYQLVMDGQQ